MYVVLKLRIIFVRLYLFLKVVLYQWHNVSICQNWELKKILHIKVHDKADIFLFKPFYQFLNL